MADDARQETTRLIEKKLRTNMDWSKETIPDKEWEAFGAYAQERWHSTPSRTSIELFLQWRESQIQ